MNFKNKQRFAIRKLAIGVASCCIGMFFVAETSVFAMETPDQPKIVTEVPAKTTMVQETQQTKPTSVPQKIQATSPVTTKATSVATTKVSVPATSPVTTKATSQPAVVEKKIPSAEVSYVRSDKGVATDDFSQYNNATYTVKIQLQNTGTEAIENARAVVDLMMTQLKPQAARLYTQYWGKQVPYTDIKQEDGTLKRQFELELGTIKKGQKMLLPLMLQSEYAASTKIKTPLHTELYGDVEKQSTLIAQGDVNLGVKVKDLAPVKISFVGNDAGFQDGDRNKPYIGEWGGSRESYAKQAQAAKAAGVHNVLAYVTTRGGYEQMPELAERYFGGIADRADYTKEYILGEIRAAKAMLGDAMNGAFLDEFSGLAKAFISVEPWYRDIVDTLKQEFGPDFYIVGSHGSPVEQRALDLKVDTYIAFEGPADRYLKTEIIHNDAMKNQDSSRFWHVVQSVTKENIDAVLAKADALNVNQLYLTDGVMIPSPHKALNVQSPYTNRPSDWVMEALKKWQAKKQPKTTQFDPNARYISPITYWKPDDEGEENTNWDHILPLGNNLGTIVLTPFGNRTWNVKSTAIRQYKLEWDNIYQGTGAPSGSDYLYRIKATKDMNVLNAADRKWTNGHDGYYYSPALVGNQSVFIRYNGTTKDETPWTIDFAVVDAETKQVVTNIASVTHGNVWREYGFVTKKSVTDTGQVLQAEEIVKESTVGTPYQSKAVSEVTDVNGKVWIYKGTSAQSPASEGRITSGSQRIVYEYTAKPDPNLISESEDGYKYKNPFNINFSVTEARRWAAKEFAALANMRKMPGASLVIYLFEEPKAIRRYVDRVIRVTK